MSAVVIFLDNLYGTQDAPILYPNFMFSVFRRGNREKKGRAYSSRVLFYRHIADFDIFQLKQYQKKNSCPWNSEVLQEHLHR